MMGRRKNEKEIAEMMMMMMMELEKPKVQQDRPHHLIMKEPQNMEEEVVGVMQLQVMTDDQMEILRKQIAVYVILCQQLASSHLHLSGVALGNAYCSGQFLPSSSVPKVAPRQRWAPTPSQLEILESIFDEGNGNPNKHRIKDITSELSQHGQISETNVYNWFQNRRARAKRRQNVPLCKPETDNLLESYKDNTDNEQHFHLKNFPC